MAFREPQKINALFKNYEGTWAVAGGWAIDLFLNTETRNHKDIEVIILRNEQIRLREFLSGWRFQYVRNGRLLAWEDGNYLELPIHEVHATSPDGDLKIELLFNEVFDGKWIFRRNPGITYPEGRWLRNTKQMIPILSPEIVLLYKAKIDEPKDESDLVNTLQLLDVAAQEWLENAIKTTHKDHRWLAMLAKTKTALPPTEDIV